VVYNARTGGNEKYTKHVDPGIAWGGGGGEGKIALTEISMSVFWVATPCGLAGRHQCFEESYCLHLQDFNSPPKLRYLPTSLNRVTTQHNKADIHRHERITSHLKKCCEGTGFNWLRTEYNGGFCKHGNKYSASANTGNFLKI
jgi:hypothetical protein